MPRFISLTVALIATLALLSAGGYVLGRWYELDTLATLSAATLKYSLYFTGACCAYACFVGVYHVFLSVTGLDEEREPPEHAAADPAGEVPPVEPARGASE